PLPDEAFLAAGALGPGRGARAGDAVVAADLALSQALAYARDLRSLYEVTREREQEIERAHDKLRVAYQQSLAYAVDLKKTHRRLQSSILQSLLGLANALEAKDEYTRGHSDRVATLARRLALAVGLGAREAVTIAHSGLLHDLGKIAVPERILRKPGVLTEEELAIMRRHPLTGAQIVAPLEFFADGALIVRHHHERQDGSGYPDGLAGEAIPIGARIVAIADVYDALTSERPYRGASTHDEAHEQMLAEAARTLDGRIFGVFFGKVRDAPPDPATRDCPRSAGVWGGGPAAPRGGAHGSRRRRGSSRSRLGRQRARTRPRLRERCRACGILVRGVDSGAWRTWALAGACDSGQRRARDRVARRLLLSCGSRLVPVHPAHPGTG